MPLGYVITGIQPRELDTQPDPVKLMYWSWIVSYGIKAKDKDFAAGLDAFGEPLRPISDYTHDHRKSAMTLDGKGDPNAPPLVPGHELSRVRSLLAGKAFVDRAEFYWKFDPWTGESFSTILTYQQEDQGRDVFGLSPESTQWVRQQALAKWRTWLKTKVVPPGLEGVKSIPPLTPATEPVDISQYFGVGKMDLTHADLGINAPARATIAQAVQRQGGMTEKELKAFFRQTAPAQVQGRPGEAYNRLLQSVWGGPGRGPSVPGVKPLLPPMPRPARVAMKPAARPIPAPAKPYALEVSGAVPAEVVAAHEKAIRAIPAPVLKTLADSGIKFAYAETLADRYPHLADVQPNGWPAGMTWGHSDGIFENVAKEVFVAQKAKTLGTDAYSASVRQKGMLYHETHHALDQALGYPSRGQAFRDAYAVDVASLPDEQKAALEYFLQPGHRGLEEMFAELGGAETGEGTMYRDIRANFPASLAVLRAIIGGLKLRLFISHIDGAVLVRARAEGPGVLGDLVETVRPGQSFMGHPYEWWFALPDGEHAV